MVQSGAFLLAQLHFEDGFEPVPPQLARHAAIHVLQTVLAGEPGSAREHPLLVLHDGFDHLHRCSTGSVVRRAGLEMLDDFSATLPRARNDGLDTLTIEQLIVKNT